MERTQWKRIWTVLGLFLLAWLAVRFLLPIGLPFLLGLLAALAAEPGVSVLQKKWHIPRGFASFLVLFLGILLLVGGLCLLGTFLYRRLTAAAGQLPDLLAQAAQSIEQLRFWALALAERAPEAMQPQLIQWIRTFFAGGTVFLEKATSGLWGIAGNVMGGIPGSAMLVGTAVLSSFMISAQLPALHKKGKRLISTRRMAQLQQTIQKIRLAFEGWLQAQFKLAGVTYAIAAGGLFLLRIHHSLFWALIIALVDALPLFGSGTILIPWALLSLIQGQGIRAIGLVGVYATAVLTRSTLEPRLVGSHLGINPLVTLAALYAGFRLWGIGGMLLAPILLVTCKQLVSYGD